MKSCSTHAKEYCPKSCVVCCSFKREIIRKLTRNVRLAKERAVELKEYSMAAKLRDIEAECRALKL